VCVCVGRAVGIVCIVLLCVGKGGREREKEIEKEIECVRKVEWGNEW
jgi:hypothetical protein